eukprot:gene20335-22336_t
MSRSIRDLREFISVSRLSFRSFDSDDEDARPKSCDKDRTSSCHSDNTKYLSTLHHSANTAIYSNQQSIRIKSPEVNLNEVVVGRPNSSVGTRRPPSARHTTKGPRTHTSSSDAEIDSCDKSLHYLSIREKTQTFGMPTCCDIENDRDDVEEMFHFVDAAVINSWLERSNKQLHCITNWLEQQQNFLKLAHFLLSDFKPCQRKQLIEMEISIILDEFQLAFRVGMDSKKVKSKDFTKLLSIVLREYPKKLFGKFGVIFILDVLYIFCSGRNENFRNLFSNVKYSTENKQIAQWLLAIRAFSLVGFCNGIIEFYSQISSSQTANETSMSNYKDGAMLLNKIHRWIFCSIELDFLDVLKYFLEKDHTFLNIVDKNGRNLVFKSVVNDRERILNFLIKEVSCDLNKSSKSGNAPLHAAISKGNMIIIKILVENGANVNQGNAESQGATPLHLAAINGDLGIVKYLVENGADTMLSMGDHSNSITAASLAKDLGHETIFEYLHTANIA